MNINFQKYKTYNQARQGGFGVGRTRRGKGFMHNSNYGSKLWIPCTKLGRLVDNGDIKELGVIYRFSLCIKEHQIVDHLISKEKENEGKLKEDVMKVMPVQKQTTAGQRTRFKAFVAVGDQNGHVGLGWKTASEVTDAIRGAIISAKMSLIPVRRGYWGAKLGNPHTICCKLTGKCGSVRMRLIPAPRGTGLVAAGAPKRLLEFAGLEDCYSSSTGHTRTKGNFLKATFYALQKSYGFLSPDFWGDVNHLKQHPFDKDTKTPEKN